MSAQQFSLPPSHANCERCKALAAAYGAPSPSAAHGMLAEAQVAASRTIAQGQTAASKVIADGQTAVSTTAAAGQQALNQGQAGAPQQEEKRPWYKSLLPRSESKVAPVGGPTSQAASAAAAVAGTASSAWQTLKTPEGKTYYFNPSTNATSWDPPPGMPQAAAAASAPVAAAVAPVAAAVAPVAAAASAWQTLSSPEGKTYYFNPSTNATSWDPPPR